MNKTINEIFRFGLLTNKKSVLFWMQQVLWIKYLKIHPDNKKSCKKDRFIGDKTQLIRNEICSKLRRFAPDAFQVHRAILAIFTRFGRATSPRKERKPHVGRKSTKEQTHRMEWANNGELCDLSANMPHCRSLSIPVRFAIPFIAGS